MVEELLWSHQNEAIKMLLQYMDDFHNGITNQAALVQHLDYLSVTNFLVILQVGFLNI